MFSFFTHVVPRIYSQTTGAPACFFRKVILFFLKHAVPPIHSYYIQVFVCFLFFFCEERRPSHLLVNEQSYCIQVFVCLFVCLFVCFFC